MDVPIFNIEKKIPQMVGGLVRMDTELYDDPRFGVKIRYESQKERNNFKADAYLYDLGIEDISKDISAPDVEEFFQAACADVFAAADEGFYPDLELLESRLLHVPEDAPRPMVFWALFRYRQGPSSPKASKEWMLSHLALRTDHDLINKVRFTYPEVIGDEGEEKFREFLLDWNEKVHNA